jgi:hypothetical protein
VHLALVRRTSLAGMPREPRRNAGDSERNATNVEREQMKDPVVSSIDVIRYAIADQVRSLGGNDKDVERISSAAAYGVWCWGFAEGQRG